VCTGTLFLVLVSSVAISSVFFRIRRCGDHRDYRMSCASPQVELKDRHHENEPVGYGEVLLLSARGLLSESVSIYV
jgi:hypothetical protein